MALDTCVEYMSGQAVPKQFIHIKKHLLQEIPGNASATLHRSVATWWRNNSADREKSWRFLFVAADLPPIKRLEFRQLFRAMIAIPILPRLRIGGNIRIRDFLQRHEGPGPHLRSRPVVGDEIEEFCDHAHALCAREVAAVRNIAAGAIADVHGRIVCERFE